MMTESELLRFMAKVVQFSDGCWIWIGARQTTGYGRWVRRRGEVGRYAHRVAYEHFVGPIPEDLCVLHDCPAGDDPACCNPAHLRLGTRTENQADMMRKGRSCRGERSGRAKLSPAQAIEIKRSSGTGREVAARYGVSDNTVYDIRGGRSWRHLEV